MHVCPFHDTISGLLTLLYLFVLLNSKLGDTGRSISFAWAVKIEYASISYM